MARPERLVVIDAAGALVYLGSVGPHGFDIDEWVEVIRTVGVRET